MVTTVLMPPSRPAAAIRVTLLAAALVTVVVAGVTASRMTLVMPMVPLNTALMLKALIMLLRAKTLLVVRLTWLLMTLMPTMPRFRVGRGGTQNEGCTEHSQ